MSEWMGHPEAELSEFLDGGLDERARLGLETHLAGCPDCAALLDDLRAITLQARSLESRPPETDLWPLIAERIGAEPKVVALPARRPRMEWRFDLSLPQLAAAAAIVAVLSGGTVWWTFKRPVVLSPVAAPALSTPATVDATPAGFDTRRYDKAVSELQQVLSENKGQLDPRTVQAVQANLAVIDAAITEARKALAADPANPYLGSHLAEQMKRKIRVLQRATDAVTADYTGANS